MTLRASSAGYVDQEVTVVPTLGPQQAVLIVPSREKPPASPPPGCTRRADAIIRAVASISAMIQPGSPGFVLRAARNVPCES